MVEYPRDAAGMAPQKRGHWVTFDRTISLGSIVAALPVIVLLASIVVAFDDVGDTAEEAAGGVKVLLRKIDAYGKALTNVQHTADTTASNLWTLTKRTEGFHGATQRNYNQLRASVTALEKTVAERSAKYDSLLGRLQDEINWFRKRGARTP